MAAATRDDLRWMVTGTRIAVITFVLFSMFADLWDLIFAYWLVGVAAVIIQRYQPFTATPQPA